MLKKIVFLGLLAVGSALSAQTAEQAWLDRTIWKEPHNILCPVRALGQDPMARKAAEELRKGFLFLYGIRGPATIDFDLTSSIELGTSDEVRKAHPDLKIPGRLGKDAFLINTWHRGHGNLIIVAGGDGRGTLYGAFALLRYVAQHNAMPEGMIRENPAMAIRWTDEWDNIDGTIERGYGGRSIFFEDGKVRDDLAPVSEYARLLASVGINGCNVNNVNNAAPFLEPEMLKGVVRIADAMRPWGVRLALSVDIASPEKIGGLKTFDPLDPKVKAWWAAKVNEIYKLIPDFAGFTVKA